MGTFSIILIFGGLFLLYYSLTGLKVWPTYTP